MRPLRNFHDLPLAALALLLGLAIDPTVVFSGRGTAGVLPLVAAHADDDDDGDDDGDDDDDAPVRIQRPRPPRAPVRPAPPPLPDAAPGEIVGLGIDDIQIDALEASGFAVIERETLAAFQTSVTRLRVPDRLTVETALGEILAVAPGAAVDANHFYTPEQGDPGGRGASCRSPDQCLAREIVEWDLPSQPGACTGGLRIGMIDTAINERHAALAGADIEVLRLGQATLPESGRQHGTAVASLFVGSRESRSPGLLPDATLIAVDTFSTRNGRDASDAFSIVRGLDHLVGRNVHVVNLSLAGPHNAVLERGVATAIQNDAMLIAAAGNEGPRADPVYPAAYTQVTAVTAVDRDKRPYRRAGRGEHVDLAAPGVGVWTAASIEGARTKTGTSFAAPFVSAAAAVLRLRTPDMDVAEIVSELTRTAEDLGDPGKDEVFGWGLMRADDLCTPPVLPVAAPGPTPAAP